MTLNGHTDLSFINSANEDFQIMTAEISQDYEIFPQIEDKHRFEWTMFSINET
jgi:hypothetical protein